MKYLVISDIHGGAVNAAKALEYFDKFSCNYVVLLGDLLNHGPRNRLPTDYDPMAVSCVLNQYKHKIISVRGNCDSEVDSMLFEFPCNAPYGYLLLKGRKVFLTHGHLHKFETLEQIEKIGLKQGDVVLSGHTHVNGIFKKESGVININVGSVTLPKGGTKASFAIVDDENITLYDLDGQTIEQYQL